MPPPTARPRHHLHSAQRDCIAFAAIVLFLIAASYVFRHSLYDSMGSGYTAGLIRGRIWLARLPNMNDSAVDAWWAAHGADDRRNPYSFGPWPRRETIGPNGWAFCFPLWLPFAVAIAGASTCWCVGTYRQRRRPTQTSVHIPNK